MTFKRMPVVIGLLLLCMAAVFFAGVYWETEQSKGTKQKSEVSRRDVITLLEESDFFNRNQIDAHFVSNDDYTLSYRITELDSQKRPGLVIAVHGSVHIGWLLVFEGEGMDDFKLIAEKPWKIVQWDFSKTPDQGYDLAEPMMVLDKKLFRVQSKTGGTGMSETTERLIYFENGQLVIAWEGIVIHHSSFQTVTSHIQGAAQLIENGEELRYWATSYKEQDGGPISELLTKTEVFRFDGTRYVPKER